MSETLGVNLMRQMADGLLEVAPSEYLLQTRDEVSTAIEELIDVGARIRPLLRNNKRVGWVRGVHLSERKALKRWTTSDVEFIEHLVTLATTLTREEVRGMNLIELRSVARVIKAMTDSDLRLYAFVSPFVTTNVSEQLWFARGVDATSYRDRYITLPDGLRMRLMLPSDQARLWAALGNYRLQAKQCLEASMNALLTIRPLVDKNADPIQSTSALSAGQTTRFSASALHLYPYHHIGFLNRFRPDA